MTEDEVEVTRSEFSAELIQDQWPLLRSAAGATPRLTAVEFASPCVRSRPAQASALAAAVRDGGPLWVLHAQSQDQPDRPLARYLGLWRKNPPAWLESSVQTGMDTAPGALRYAGAARVLPERLDRALLEGSGKDRVLLRGLHIDEGLLRSLIAHHHRTGGWDLGSLALAVARLGGEVLRVAWGDHDELVVQIFSESTSV